MLEISVKSVSVYSIILTITILYIALFAISNKVDRLEQRIELLRRP